MSAQQLNMQGKVALVTGASSGLGAHFAKVLAEAGAQVVVGARRAEKLEELVSTIQALGGKALAVNLDVTEADSITAALDSTESVYGPVTVLINNAGVADSSTFLNIDEARWDFTMDTNLKGNWRVASAVAHRLIKHNKAGSIVNIASILGLRVGFGESAYAISKAAVVQMTKAMALELGRKGIRTNAICPGYFKTEMNEQFFDSDKGKEYVRNTPAQRVGELEELNIPLLLLASDAGSFMNGAIVPVDGGHLVSSL